MDVATLKKFHDLMQAQDSAMLDVAKSIEDETVREIVLQIILRRSYSIKEVIDAVADLAQKAQKERKQQMPPSGDLN